MPLLLFRLRVAVVLASCALVACHAETTPEANSANAASDAGTATLGSGVLEPSAMDGGALPAAPYDASVVGYAGRPSFCDRPGDDAIRDLFCGAAAPKVDSLRTLQRLLGLNLAAQGASNSTYDEVSPDDAGLPASPDASTALAADASASAPDASDAYDAGSAYPSSSSSSFTTVIADYFVLLGHSTALSGRFVSPINPRLIMLGQSSVMAFNRGVQQVELVTHARDVGGFNFYLINFEQACTTRRGGCSAGDLYTPRIEADWTRVTARDAEDLKNTPSDCRQCHQRGRARPVLLMRELESPWTHFFEPDPEGSPAYNLPGVRGKDLVEDYVRAKGGEPYGGIPASGARQTVGFVLQNLAGNGQPLLFDAPTIENERWPRGDAGYAAAPAPSPTWERAYEAFKRGEQLALPYVEPRATDPQKQARLTDAYRAYRAGKLTAEQLPDLSDIFPDDGLVRARIGLQTEPSASPAQALIQACGSCHNDVLDQTISRAHFNIDLSRMSRAELDLARERLQRSPGTPGIMPPPEGRQLDPAARAALLDYLQNDARSSDDDALLARAAQLGMAGGGQR